MSNGRIRENNAARGSARIGITGLIAVAAFLVPALLLPPSIGLMHALVFGSLILFAIVLVLPAMTPFITVAGRLTWPLACLAAALGVAGILLVYQVAAPIASPGAAAVAALWLGALFGTAMAWRLPAGTVRALIDRSMIQNLLTALLLIAALAGYGWAVAVTIDQAQDRATPQRFVAELYARNIWHNRKGQAVYALNLAPWGKQPARAVNVDPATYDAVTAGTNVCPLLHHGLLGIGWYRITPCPAALRAVTHHVPRDLPAEKRRNDMLLLPVLLLFGMIGLGLAGSGLATGQIDGRGDSYRRADRPIMFWLHVLLWLVVSSAMLFGAASLAIEIFG
ncbi:MAG: hypothetical protein WC804_18415 [Sphingomonas sp.]|jgi:hypothetical protein|uniref:hypothetical protein n=1 Tax=Sphingomonas sp. TaxID=28214 RepID=UPI00356B1C02